MSSAIIQLIVLAGIALFLILRLKSVLGTRTGFEKPAAPRPVQGRAAARPDLEVIEGGVDHDIADFVDIASDAGKALAAMKRADPDFTVVDFMEGAKAAYEMILMAFENGDLETLERLLDPEIFAAFKEVVESREAEGLRIDAQFIGLREVKIVDASFDETTREAEITLRFVAELTSVVRDRQGQIVEGNPEEIRRQTDIWTFARVMGDPDPNWILVATGA